MIYLVSGFMRSGTSMLMQALEAGGMAVVKDAQRDQLNAAHSDVQYQPNPVSLYEPTVAHMRHPGFPRMYDGQVVKIVVPFLPMLAVHDYRVVFLRRDAEEIRQSYEGAFGAKLTTAQIDRAVEEGLKTLRNRKDVRDVFELDYAETVAHPGETCYALTQIGWPIDVLAAMAVVDPARYRFRREALTVGL
jgi:hypothetical protein